MPDLVLLLQCCALQHTNTSDVVLLKALSRMTAQAGLRNDCSMLSLLEGQVSKSQGQEQ